MGDSAPAQSGGAWLPSRLRRHWPLCILLGIGGLVRLLTMVAYPPALLYPDSWGYIATAYAGPFVSVATEHPSGYPALIRLLTLPDRSLLELVMFQHVAGLGVGVGVYAALTRARVPRWGATAAAALVLLDGYMITLEQYVMSDTFFDATMLAAALVLAWPRLAPRRSSSDPSAERVGAPGGATWARALICGLLLAGASLERETAPFAIPVFLIYLAWVRAGWRALVAFVLAVTIPLLAYSAAVDAQFGVFGLTATSGWTLYGRVAGFADCQGVKLEAAARPLCETGAERASHPTTPDWYIWGPSPARLLFKPATEPVSSIARTNATLNSFADAIIRHQPLAYAEASLSAFGRDFIPGSLAQAHALDATSLPVNAGQEATSAATRNRDLPGLHPTVRAPSGLIRSYRSIVHLPRPVLAVLALAAVLGVLIRVPSRREVFLLAGAGLILLLGTAATGGPGMRYLLPSVPLIAIGGSIALAQLAPRFRPRLRAIRRPSGRGA